MHLTGSIVLYNNKANEIRSAIQSFLHSSIGGHLYLIDNSKLNTSFPVKFNGKTTYIQNSSNIGFGAGHNVALRKVLDDQNSSYHLVFNPDVFFEAQVIEELVTVMENNPDIGLIMPKVLYPDGRTQYLCKLLPTPRDLIGRRFFSFLPAFKRLNARYEMRFANYNQSMDVPFLSGSFMLLRTQSIHEVGLFDERYFLYMEDVDLCRRIGQKYRTLYYPHVHVTHAFKKASYKQFRLLYQHMRSAVLYFNKWGWIQDRERRRVNQETVKKYFILDP
jgi:hypothetical protein